MNPDAARLTCADPGVVDELRAVEKDVGGRDQGSEFFDEPVFRCSFVETFFVEGLKLGFGDRESVTRGGRLEDGADTLWDPSRSFTVPVDRKFQPLLLDLDLVMDRQVEWRSVKRVAFRGMGRVAFASALSGQEVRQVNGEGRLSAVPFYRVDARKQGR